MTGHPVVDVGLAFLLIIALGIAAAWSYDTLADWLADE